MGISVLLLHWLIFVWLFFQSEASYLACTENHKNWRYEITLPYKYVQAKLADFQGGSISEISESKIQALGAGHCGQEVIL